MVVEEDLSLGGEHTIQYRDAVLHNCIFETYIILLTSIILINLILFFFKEANHVHTW